MLFTKIHFIVTLCLMGLLPLWASGASNDYPQSLAERRNAAMGSIMGPTGLSINLSSKENAPKAEDNKNTATSTSNKALWQAAIKCLDSREIISANYESGTILTDWYKEGQTESKITVIIQDHLTGAEGLKVIAFKRISSKNVMQSSKHNAYKDDALANKIANDIIEQANIK